MDEFFSEFRLLVKHAHHLFAINNCGAYCRQRRGGSHAHRVADDAAFAKKIAGTKNGQHRFLALRIYDGELGVARLDVPDFIAGIVLRKERLPFFIFNDAPRHPSVGKVLLNVETWAILRFFRSLGHGHGSLTPIMSRLVSKVNDPRVGNDSRVLTTWPTSKFHNVIAPRNPATKNRSRYDLRLKQSHGVDYDCAPGYFANMHFASAISCCCLPCSRSVEREALA